MNLSEKLIQAKQAFDRQNPSCPTPQTPFVLFFSITEGSERANVLHAVEKTPQHAWKKLAGKLQSLAKRKKITPRWLRIDWISQIEPHTWQSLTPLLKNTKRNYFRQGIALGNDFKHCFLEQELNANAMLYTGNTVSHAQLNPKNFQVYASKRFGNKLQVNFDPGTPIHTFNTQGLIIDEQGIHLLVSQGRDSGRRQIEQLNADQTYRLIDSASQFLATQVFKSGKFVYGLHPCFDRKINTYNTLRHASTTYSMLEAWEVTRNPKLMSAITRSLDYLTQQLIQRYPQPQGGQLAFLTDLGDEIKLGGNAVAILALVKYTELTGSQQYLTLLEELALGIQSMQNPQTGQFTHVLNSKDLSVKEQFRIIYYDGEAAFGLMRLYGLTKDERWIQTVEKAFEYFIAKQHWRAHDHWLSYCVNELTLYRPEPKYYQFGIQNVSGYLDFVIERITTFPTLLELMMAAHKMIQRMQQDPKLSQLLQPLDLDKFYRALNIRAHYLLNGHFWPEFAMYFKNPNRILGSFFIRHHGFRVRIDDVEHYLSGYIAYLNYYLKDPQKEPHSSNPESEQNPTIPAQQPDPNPQAQPQAIDNTEDLLTFNFAPKPAPALAEPQKEMPRQDHAIVAWGGDVNLGRRQHFRSRQIGFPKTLDIPELSQADLSIVNLECVVSTLGEQGVIKGEGGPYYYRARPEMLQVLTHAKIDALATANNHSGDYGPQALVQQKEILDALGIPSAGTGKNLQQAFQPIYLRANQFKIALFSIDSTQHRFQATQDQPGAAYLPLSNPQNWYQTLRPKIEQARQQADYVFVAVHWGANQLDHPDQQEIAVGHAIIDAGADAILGASAHKIQGIEIYNNKPIIHDAGDLLFDSVRPDLANSGIFQLTLTAKGIERVTFIPVGVGYGFSRTLSAEAAQKATQEIVTKSKKFGTELNTTSNHHAYLDLVPTRIQKPAQQGTLPNFTQYNLEALDRFRPSQQHGQVEQVPQSAQIQPVNFGALQLIGIQVRPTLINQRKMIWVETFWSTSEAINESIKLDIRAVPTQKTTMPDWGKSMDHDPCDWMQPTENWQPDKIYRDFYGLRPPMAKHLKNVPLKIHVNVQSQKGVYQAYIHPESIELHIPGKDTLSPAHQYRTQFPQSINTIPQGQTWNADQLAEITGGTWTTQPPQGWYICSVVNGAKHLDMLPTPSLFVAHTNHDRALHEGSTQPIKTLGDRHTLLPTLSSKLAGAIVKQPVNGLPVNFPQLQVQDPIKALIELGFAARARYQGPVIAVTGTAGKSSVINLIKTLMLGHAPTTQDQRTILSSIDNYNSRVGVPALLASLSPHHKAAIIEVAQSALWMQRGPITRQINPTISVLTEIHFSQTNHMTKSTQDVAKWKSKIFDGLNQTGTAIFGEHLKHYDYIHQQAQLHTAHIITYGTSQNATVRLIEQALHEDHTNITIEIKHQRYIATLPFISQGMINNALAAISVLVAQNQDIAAHLKHFQAYQPEEGRLETYKCQIDSHQVRIIDDSWNAEVISMLNAFEVLKQQKAPRKIAVLGRIVHLGDQAKPLHESLAAPLTQTGVDLVITHGDEMKYLRNQLPEQIKGQHFDQAQPLYQYLAQCVQQGDLILLKGSRRDSDFGELSQILKTNITNTGINQ